MTSNHQRDPAENDSSSMVVFDDSPQKVGIRTVQTKKTSRLVEWTIKYSGGFVSNEKQAQRTLLIFVSVAVFISLVLLFSASRSPVEEVPQELINSPQPA